MKMKIWKRLLGLLLSAAILVGAMPVALAAENESEGFSWRQVDNSAVTASLKRRPVPEKEAEESPYAENETVRVSIELKDVPTMEKFNLKRSGEYAVNSTARIYRSRLEARQQAVTSAISKQALRGKKLDVVWNLTLAANIISANVEYGKIDDIKKVAGVKSVFMEKQYAPDAVSVGGDKPKMQISTDMTGTQSGAWANGYRGQGMRVAIIDTGLDTDHQSFDEEAFEHALEEDMPEDGKTTVTEYDLLDKEKLPGVLTQLNAYKNCGATVDDLYYTAKIPYGYCYVDKDADITHDYDNQGEHGSHVAGISVANRYLKTDSGFVSAMDTVHMTGQAPDAQVLVMKVFGNGGGAYDSDYMAAIEDAIVLGCDTINLSLGSANPGFAVEPNYVYQSILDSLVEENANAIVTVSAGNSGGWADGAVTGGALYSDDVSFSTAGSPGSYTNSLCVASVDNAGAAIEDDVVGGETDAGSESQYIMSDFSSWGVPGDLSLKPEITAPGGNIWSVNGAVPDTDQYELMSGTSMAAPQAAGIGALVKQFIETTGYSQTGMTDRALAQSLMMSTATPLKDENGRYYSVLQQGAGLLNAAAAISADSYITVEGQNDGKVKFELGDDPEKTGTYQVRFDIHNLDGEAREYELSGGLFTQAAEKDEESGFTLLTKGTKELKSSISWEIEGAAPMPHPDVRGCDFNGDGTVDRKDAQLLLDHVVKAEALVENGEKADIDGDGNVDTRDVHEFLKKLSVESTTVPANGKITVTATITLDAADAAAQLADCPKGFYVEGYLRAVGKAIDDGTAGTTHSIPLLGYYGNWTDPSMFEKGSTLEYAAEGGSALPPPYTRTDGKTNSLNYLWIEYANGESGMLGCNPYDVEESVCLPERAAMNSENGDLILEWRYCSIRNAAASRATVKNAEDPAQVYKVTGNMGPVESAFFDVSYYVPELRNAMNFLLVDWAGTDDQGAPLPDGTVVELGVTLAPEYYVDGKNVDWDGLGEGASLTQQVTIDNTAPELLDVENQDKTIGADRTVTLEARDNRYVAAIALLDPTGTKILSAQCPNQVEKGVTAAVTLDLSKVVGKKFFVQVMDYACNTATYEVKYEGLESEITDPDYVFFDQGEDNWYGLQNGPSQKLGVLNNSGSTYYAAELVNGCLFALDGPEKFGAAFSSTLYAMPVGDTGDFKKVTTIPYTDFDGKARAGYPMDMAYSKKDQKLYVLVRIEGDTRLLSYLYSVDPMTGAVKLEGYPLDAKKNPVRLATLAIDDSNNDNRFYSLSDSADSFVATSLFQFSLSDLSTPEEKKAMPGGVKLDNSLSCLQSYASTDWDSESGKLVYALTPCGTSSFWYKGNPRAPTMIYELDPVNPRNTPGVVYTGGEAEMYSLAGLAVKDTDDAFSLEPADQAAGVVLSQTELGMAKGGSFQLEAIVAPWTLENREVTWESSDLSVATVTDAGKVTATGPGTAVITATTKAAPYLSAQCAVSVITIEANLKALAWDAEGTVWWSNVNTAGLPRYERIKEADAHYIATAMTEDGTLYAASYGESLFGNVESDLFSVDPETLEETWIAPITMGGETVYVNDLAPIPTLSRNMGTDYLFGICAGVAGLIINGSTGEVEVAFSLNTDANVSPVGVTHLMTVPVDESGSLADVYAYVGADGGVYTGGVLPYGETVQETLAFVQQAADFETGVSTHGCTDFNSLVFAAAEDGTPYLFWSVFDGNESYSNSAQLYAIDINSEKTYMLGSFPAGVWPVAGLLAEKVPSVEASTGYSERLKVDVDGFRKLESVDGLNPELLEKIKEAPEKQAEEQRSGGGLCSIEVKDDEGRQSVQAVTVNESAKTVTVPVAATRSANGQLTLSYDDSVLTFRSLSYSGSALHSDNTGTPGEIAVGYADVDEINGKLVEAVFVYEPGEEEQATSVSLKVLEDGGDYHAAPLDGGSVEITLPAKPAEPTPPPVVPGPSEPEPEPEPKPEPEPGTPKFVDVPENAWYHDDVYRAAEMGLVYGTGEDRFSPGVRLTRGMLAAILYRLEGQPQTAAGGNFTDVPSGKWFSDGVNWAASKGIVAGYENGEYGPEDPITREQFAAIMARYAKFKSYDTAVGADILDGYRDGQKVSGWARESLAWTCAMKIIYGKGSGILDPQGEATRAEAAAILIRFIDLPGK